MAVEACGLHHLLPTGRDHSSAHANRAGPAMSDAPFSARELAGGAVGTFGQPMAGQDQYSQFLAQRGGALRKRKYGEEPPALVTADVTAQAHQQLVDVDRLVLNHTAKMWAKLADQRRRHMRQIVATVEANTAKRLRARDEEIERIRRLNWALEERLKTIYVEAQVWRDLAQSNEAAANALRTELEQALDEQARSGTGTGAGGDDAESYCCGENDDVAVCAEEEADGRGTVVGRCRGCGEGAAVALLLPCRHLCVCSLCAAAARVCPACGCAKNGSVCVNLS